MSTTFQNKAELSCGNIILDSTMQSRLTIPYYCKHSDLDDKWSLPNIISLHFGRHHLVKWDLNIPCKFDREHFIINITNKEINFSLYSPGYISLWMNSYFINHSHNQRYNWNKSIFLTSHGILFNFLIK